MALEGSSAQANALLLNLDPQQQEAATAIRGPVAIIAGAGTGKPGQLLIELHMQLKVE